MKRDRIKKRIIREGKRKREVDFEILYKEE